MAKITYIGCESGERGEIVKFDIDGKRYEYDVGHYFMDRINKLAVHNPGMALNTAKTAGKLVPSERHHVVTIGNSMSLNDSK